MAPNWLAKQIINRPWTWRYAIPFSRWYADKMGYRQLGLRLEDLLPEETEVMQLALKRLPPKEAYDRVFRIRRAMQLSLSHQILPKEEWTPYEEDTNYLSRIVDEIEIEIKEREDLDGLNIRRKQPAPTPKSEVGTEEH